MGFLILSQKICPDFCTPRKNRIMTRHKFHVHGKRKMIRKIAFQTAKFSSNHFQRLKSTSNAQNLFSERIFLFQRRKFTPHAEKSSRGVIFMKKFVRRALTIVLIVFFALSAAIVGAAVKIFDGTGQYIMNNDGNHEFGKKRAQQRAERDAQKKAGVALKTFSRSINSELTDEEVSAVTNNIIKISDLKIVPVPFEAEVEAGLMYRATLKATIDTDGVYSWFN